MLLLRDILNKIRLLIEIAIKKRKIRNLLAEEMEMFLEIFLRKCGEKCTILVEKKKKNHLSNQNTLIQQKMVEQPYQINNKKDRIMLSIIRIVSWKIYLPNILIMSVKVILNTFDLRL